MAPVGRSADEAGRQIKAARLLIPNWVSIPYPVRTGGYEVILLSMRIATFEGEAPREGAQFLPKTRSVVG